MNIKVLIAIVSIPAFLSIFAAVFQVYYGEWQLSISGLLYPTLGLLALYLVIFGKAPKFLVKQNML